MTAPVQEVRSDVQAARAADEVRRLLADLHRRHEWEEAARVRVILKRIEARA